MWTSFCIQKQYRYCEGESYQSSSPRPCVCVELRHPGLTINLPMIHCQERSYLYIACQILHQYNFSPLHLQSLRFFSVEKKRQKCAFVFTIKTVLSVEQRDQTCLIFNTCKTVQNCTFIDLLPEASLDSWNRTMYDCMNIKDRPDCKVMYA